MCVCLCVSLSEPITFVMVIIVYYYDTYYMPGIIEDYCSLIREINNNNNKRKCLNNIKELSAHDGIP